jgi:hypothetical protein
MAGSDLALRNDREINPAFPPKFQASSTKSQTIPNLQETNVPNAAVPSTRFFSVRSRNFGLVIEISLIGICLMLGACDLVLLQTRKLFRVGSLGDSREHGRRKQSLASAIAIAGLLGLCVVATGQPVSGQPMPNEPVQWKQSIERPSRSWDYDGKRILGHVGHDICLWDAATGKLLHRMKGHKERIQAVQFSPDGNHALSSSWMGPGGMAMLISRDTSVIVWDLATGRDRHVFKGQVAGEFSPDGRRIVSFSQRPGTGEPNPDWGVSTLPSTGEVWQLGPAAKFDAAVWDARTGRQLAKAELGEDSGPYWGSLHFSPDGRSIVRTETGIALLFNASDGRETGRQSQRLARSLRYTSRGDLATVDPEQIRLTDIKSGQAIYSIQHGLKAFGVPRGYTMAAESR